MAANQTFQLENTTGFRMGLMNLLRKKTVSGGEPTAGGSRLWYGQSLSLV